MGIEKKKIVAVVCAASIAAGGWFYAGQLDDEHESLVADQIEVVKAARNINAGYPLTKDRITTEKVPRKFLPPNPLLESELNIYLGKPLTANVEEGAMLLTHDFAAVEVPRAAVQQMASPLVIKTAAMTVEAKKPAEVSARALEAVRQARGYIVSSDIQVNRDFQSFQMTARVPAGEFETVLVSYGELGLIVKQRVRGAGVTADVQRLERKLGNQEFLIEGLQRARPKPKAVKEKSIEIIAGDRRDKIVERETTTYDDDDTDQKLVDAEHEFEELQAEMDELRADTALSTIELTIQQPTPAPEPLPEEPELSKSEQLAQEFMASSEALVRGLFTTMRIFAKILPMLIFGIPFFAMAFAVWYRRRRDESEGSAE